MSTEVRVPTLPESVSDATVLTWHKQPGEAIGRDENLVDLETDKVVLEVPSPVAGVVKEHSVEAGAIVTADELLALVEAGAAPAATATEPPTSPEKIKEAEAASTQPAATPAAAEEPFEDAASAATEDVAEGLEDVLDRESSLSTKTAAGGTTAETRMTEAVVLRALLVVGEIPVREGRGDHGADDGVGQLGGQVGVRLLRIGVRNRRRRRPRGGLRVRCLRRLRHVPRHVRVGLRHGPLRAQRRLHHRGRAGLQR